jgi:hypothetical protein
MEELWKLKSNGYPCHMPLCIMNWLISSFFRLTQRCILICNEEVHIYSIPFDSGTPQLGTRDRNSKTLNLTLRFADTTEFELRHWTDLESWGSGTIQRARGAVAAYSDPAWGERRRCSGLTTEENVLGFPQMPTGRRPWSRRWGGGGERSLGPALACLLPTPYMRTIALASEEETDTPCKARRTWRRMTTSAGRPRRPTSTLKLGPRDPVSDHGRHGRQGRRRSCHGGVRLNDDPFYSTFESWGDPVFDWRRFSFLIATARLDRPLDVCFLIVNHYTNLIKAIVVLINGHEKSD